MPHLSPSSWLLWLCLIVLSSFFFLSLNSSFTPAHSLLHESKSLILASPHPNTTWVSW